MSKKAKMKSAKSVTNLAMPSGLLDPALAALFDSSLSTHKPTPAPTISKHTQSAGSPRSEGASPALETEEAIPLDQNTLKLNGHDEHASSRKRKRKAAEVEIEDTYLQRLEVEQAREDAKRRRTWEEDEKDGRLTKITDGKDISEDGADDIAQEDEMDSDEAGSNFEAPLHETVAQSKDDAEIEKASRTVFLGNVSTTAIKSKASRRILLDHLTSFIPELPEHKPPHKIESLRFRSTAFATAAVPKKAAFAKKELMDATTQSTNAYAVYSTTLATREATKRLNGTIVLDRHLRVDSVAHPSTVDHRRCVFVGNLGFVDDESNIKVAEEQEGGTKKVRKSKAPADIEEGLWKQFETAGTVESVRVVRDKTTRVGKGVAYVQFKDANSVEKALLFNGKKYPPLLPRLLRVTRAKNITKTSSYAAKDRAGPKTSREAIYQPKPSSHAQSLAGRAGKLFGRAGAAHVRSQGKDVTQKRQKVVGGIAKTPESIVFEGHRASRNQGKGTLKLGGKKSGKTAARRTKRSTAFKAAASKKRRA